MSRDFAGYHYDIIAAKNGDGAARARVERLAKSDPDAHAVALREIAEELRERWRRLPRAAAFHEFTLWSALANDDLLKVEIYEP